MCLSPCPAHAHPRGRPLSLGLPLPSDTAPVGSGPTFPATQGHHAHNSLSSPLFWRCLRSQTWLSPPTARPRRGDRTQPSAEPLPANTLSTAASNAGHPPPTGSVSSPRGLTTDVLVISASVPGHHWLRLPHTSLAGPAQSLFLVFFLQNDAGSVLNPLLFSTFLVIYFPSFL